MHLARKPRCHSTVSSALLAGLRQRFTCHSQEATPQFFSAFRPQEEASVSTTADGVGEASMTVVRDSKKTEHNEMF
jgi:hypothetical protein